MNSEKSPTPIPFVKARPNKRLQVLDRCFFDLLLTSSKENYDFFSRKSFVGFIILCVTHRTLYWFLFICLFSPDEHEIYLAET